MSCERCHVPDKTPEQSPYSWRPLWPTDSAYLEWGLYPLSLFWEQRIKKDVFAFRIGQQALDTFD